MTTAPDICDRLGCFSSNRDHLPLLEAQFSTRAGIVPFVGAGLSVSFGFPQWGSFLLELASEGGLIKETTALLAAAQYEEAASMLMTRLQARRFQDLLAKRFGDHVLEGRQISGAVTELIHLPPGPIITTNFDRVVEIAFTQGRRSLEAYWHSYAGAGSEALQQDRPFLLKLHGNWSHPASRVLTLEEYNEAYGDPTLQNIDFARPIPTLLFKILSSRCCLFLGCSLKQDRTMALLRTVARGVPNLVHYAIAEAPESDAEHRARAAELSAQSIRPIWYAHGRHDLIQPLLRHLAEKAAEGLRRLVDNLNVGSVPRSRVPNNVPDLGNVTIGRESEIQQVHDMLRVARLVSITGAGGSGKSRLAIEVALAEKSKERYINGIWFIPLGGLAQEADREGVLATRIGKILGVPEQAGRPPYESLVDHLAAGRYLLVIDNCEHLITSCRELTADLLKKCPDLTVLTTSRRALGLQQERLYPLAPLVTPDPEAPFDEIASNESVVLFKMRATERVPSWELRPDKAEPVATLCRALAGIPLAIEVAAARLGVQSVEGMAAHAVDLMTALGNQPAGELQRQRTLAAALRWSYGLLSKDEQRFMRAMTVFDGGWNEAAAAAVFDGRHPESVLDYLQTLFENSLIVTTDVSGAKRFRFLEPIRQVVQLEVKPREKAKLQRRHADHFLTLVETAAPHLLQADQAKWLDTLQVEVDNLRAVSRWTVENKDAERGLRLIASLWRFAEIRGYLKEGRARGEDALAIEGGDAFPLLQSKVLSGVGILAYRQADFDQAHDKFSRSLEIATKLQDDAGIANASNDLGMVATMRGDFLAARQLYGDSLAIEQRVGNARAIAVARFNLGAVALGIGENEDAERLLTESLKGFRAGGNDRESAFPLNALGQLYAATGRFVLAREHAQESLELRQKLKDTKGTADSLRTLGWAALEAGDFILARKQLVESITLARGVGDRRGISETLELFAVLCAREDRFLGAVELFAASEEIRRGFNYALPPVRASRRDALLEHARAIGGSDAYDAAWRRGSSLQYSDVVDSVIKEPSAQLDRPGAFIPADRR